MSLVTSSIQIANIIVQVVIFQKICVGVVFVAFTI